MDSINQKWNQASSFKDLKITDQGSPGRPPMQQQGTDSKLVRRISKRNVGIKKNSQSEGLPQIYESFELTKKVQAKQDVVFIVMCLKMHFVFSSLSDSQLHQMAESMFYCKLAPGQAIIKQGDNASSFFIIEKGKIQVLVENQPKKELVTGNGFGELALLYNAPRSATCKAMDECYLWGIDRHTFRKTVEQIVRSEQEKNRKYMTNVKFFNELTNEQKDAIAGVLISQKFAKDQVIVNEGDQASSFYIIAEGKIGVFKDGQMVRTLQANESFGEQALLHENQVRQMTVKAVEGDAKVLALGRDMITKILGDQVTTIIYKNICKWTLQKSKLWNNLPQSVLDKLLEGVTFKALKAGEKIIKQGDPFGILVIVVEGQVANIKHVVLASKGDIILETTLEEKYRGGNHPDTVVMETDGVVGFIDYESFRKQQGSAEQIVSSHQQKLQGSSALIASIKQKSLKDLIFITQLGSGQFGSVYLVKFKGTDQLFALKYVTRAHVQQFGIQKHIQQEKAVLELMDHQFILQFYRSFKDNENIYFLTEFIPGFELFDAIRVIGTIQTIFQGLLQKNDAQLYVASMLLQMEYIHTTHHIVYRDIKPENIMVDDQGYLKLIDMGTAKTLKSSTGGTNKTFTIIGTPHYMAPEVISGKGYNYTADLWSVGVCLYEFICGGLPFGEEAEDPFDIYQEIVKKNITYPAYMADKTAKSFIEQLMNKTPELRLGGSYTALKAHAWFKDFNWEALLAKKLKTPVLPPKDKIMTKAQIDDMEKKNILVVQQIEKDTKGQKKVLATPKDAEWDHVF